MDAVSFLAVYHDITVGALIVAIIGAGAVYAAVNIVYWGAELIGSFFGR